MSHTLNVNSCRYILEFLWRWLMSSRGGEHFAHVKCVFCVRRTAAFIQLNGKLWNFHGGWGLSMENLVHAPLSFCLRVILEAEKWVFGIFHNFDWRRRAQTHVACGFAPRSHRSDSLVEKFWWIFTIFFYHHHRWALLSHMNLAWIYHKIPKYCESDEKRFFCKFANVCCFSLHTQLLFDVGERQNVIKSLFSLPINRLWRLRVESTAFISTLEWLRNLNNVVKLSNPTGIAIHSSSTEQISNLNFPEIKSLMLSRIVGYFAYSRHSTRQLKFYRFSQRLEFRLYFVFFEINNNTQSRHPNKGESRGCSLRGKLENVNVISHEIELLNSI